MFIVDHDVDKAEGDVYENPIKPRTLVERWLHAPLAGKRRLLSLR